MNGTYRSLLSMEEISQQHYAVYYICLYLSTLIHSITGVIKFNVGIYHRPSGDSWNREVHFSIQKVLRDSTKTPKLITGQYIAMPECFFNPVYHNTTIEF